MAITSEIVAVTDSATALNAVGTDSVSGQTIKISNRHGSESADLGPAGVTDGGGYELLKDEGLELKLPANEVLYAIARAGQTVPMHVLRIGV